MPFLDPAALNNSGRVYGTAYRCADEAYEGLDTHAAVYKDGVVKLRQRGFVLAANERGVMGGSVLADPVNFFEQAALFHGNQVELVPRLSGEVTSFVTAVNDTGSALVTSFNEAFDSTQVLYRNGESTVLEFEPEVTNTSGLAINNKGTVSGTQGSSICDDMTGFRFDSVSGDLQLLWPLSTEPAALGVDVNGRGQVLGYSFVCSGLERIGLWDRHGSFQTWFVEGTPEVPTISDDLLFNNRNLIVITSVSSPDAEDSRNTYLVPRPGVRLDIADLIRNKPAWLNLSLIRDINARGSMIGVDVFSGGSYPLHRMP